MEAHVPPGGGPPPHVHHREDEAFHVLSGDFEIIASGQPVRLGPGEFLLARRDVPHQFKNVGPTEVRMLINVTPAGLENLFAEIGTRLKDRNDAPVPPSAEDIARLLEAAPR